MGAPVRETGKLLRCLVSLVSGQSRAACDVAQSAAFDPVEYQVGR